MTIPKDGVYRPDIATKFANQETHAKEPEVPISTEVALPADENDPVAITKKLCFQLDPEGADQPLHAWVYRAFHKAYQAGHHAAAGILPLQDETEDGKPSGYIHPLYGFYASDTTLKYATDQAYEAGKVAGTIASVPVVRPEYPPYPWGIKFLEGTTLISALVAVGWFLTHYGYLVHN